MPDVKYCMRCAQPGPFINVHHVFCARCYPITVQERHEAGLLYQRARSAAVNELRRRHPERFKELLTEERGGAAATPTRQTEAGICPDCGRPGPFINAHHTYCRDCYPASVTRRKAEALEYQRARSRASNRMVNEFHDEYMELLEVEKQRRQITKPAVVEDEGQKSEARKGTQRRSQKDRGQKDDSKMRKAG